MTDKKTIFENCKRKIGKFRFCQSLRSKADVDPTHKLQLKNGSMFGVQTMAINSLKRSPTSGVLHVGKIASPPGLDDIRRSVLKTIKKRHKIKDVR
jgi:hypothetical protein